MASSYTLIDLIHSALDELHILKGAPQIFGLNKFTRLRFWLGNLKMALLSATKLGINLNPSYLVKTENEVLKIAEKIHTYNRVSPDACWSNNEKVYWQNSFIYHDELTKELYAPLLDAPRKSSVFTTDEVLEFINLSLVNLKNFQDLKGVTISLRDALRALGEQLMFLRTLILFVMQRNVESQKGLFAHAGAVVIDAAVLLFDDAVSEETCGYRTLELSGSSVEKRRLHEISTLIQKIKPIHPEIYKIYTEALTMARSLAPTDQVTVDVTLDFLSSLVSIFFEDLARSTHAHEHVEVAIENQLLELYDGFRSLRQTILEQHPNKLDMKIELDIVNLVCDIGVFIFSFQHTHMETELSTVQELSDAIKVVLSELGEIPKFNSRSTTQLAFLDFLSEKLMELSSNDNVEPSAESWVQSVRGELVFLRSFLGDIVDLPNNKEEIQTLMALMDHILEVAYRVEDVFDCLLVGNLPGSVSESVFSILKEFNSIKSEVEVMKISEIKFKKVSVAQIEVKLTAPSIAKEIVGFNDHSTTIIDRLMRGSRKLRIVAIVGMAGLGKTTLAEKVYDDPIVWHHFSVRAFTTVSQTFDKKSLLADIIKQVDPDKYAQITSEESADDAADQLRRSLKGKRYLIVLDDIWEARAWQQLQGSFPDDSKGSRIVVASRHHDVIALSNMLDDKPFELTLLNKDESMNLLQRKLFGGKGWPSELGDLLMQIVEVCNGLPLTIVVVAGLLRSMKPDDWKKTVDSLNSSNLSERCRDTLELSYRHLHEHLKPCLLYFATFKEDQHVSVQRLLSLWMAEGFIRKVEMKHLSIVAEGYLDDLIGRSLVTVSKRTSMGRVKSCRIHDLLYKFCVKRAKEEQFFHYPGEGSGALSGFSESRHIRRLCISSGANNFIESKAFCPQLRSVRFEYGTIQDAPSVTLIMNMCKLLRVLDLEHIYLLEGIPSQIGQLVRLAYLAMNGDVPKIPASIGNLSVLETLKVSFYRCVSPLLPESFWNLRKLKHLSFPSPSHGRHNVGAGLSIENLDNSSDMCELDTVSGVVIPYDAVERVLKKFTNLRDLKFQLHGSDNYKGNLCHIVVPDILTQLESVFVYDHATNYPKVDFSLPTNLKKLTLQRFQLNGRMFSSIGMLPNLEYLRFIDVEFEGGAWIMEEEQFSKLRILKLNSFFLHRGVVLMINSGVLRSWYSLTAVNWKRCLPVWKLFLRFNRSRLLVVLER